jgi:hypothetical protein
MGIEWAAELRIEFEMEAVLKTKQLVGAAVAEFERCDLVRADLEGGPTSVAKSNVTCGTVKATIIKQGSTRPLDATGGSHTFLWRGLTSRRGAITLQNGLPHRRSSHLEEG